MYLDFEEMKNFFMTDSENDWASLIRASGVCGLCDRELNTWYKYIGIGPSCLKRVVVKHLLEYTHIDVKVSWTFAVWVCVCCCLVVCV